MNELLMYAVYENPSDFPGKFVVRQWRVKDGEIAAATEAGVADTLDAARRLVPRGYVRTARFQQDDPVIAEVWV